MNKWKEGGSEKRKERRKRKKEKEDTRKERKVDILIQCRLCFSNGQEEGCVLGDAKDIRKVRVDSSKGNSEKEDKQRN